MKSKLAKILSSFTMAAVLTCTSVAAQAAEVVTTEYADTLSIGSCATNIKNIYKTNYPDQAEMIDEIVDTLSADNEFINIFESEGATAFQIIEDSLRDALEPSVSTFSAEAVSYQLPVCEVNQHLDDHCGPASALQALASSGKISTPAENQAKDAVIAAGIEMKTGREGYVGTNITLLSGYMNKYETSSTIKYKAKAFTRYSYDNALDFVIYSLANGRAPVMRVYDTSLMSYYGGKEYSHYVTIVGVNTNTGLITIADPHFEDKFRGGHTISISEFNALMKGDSRTVDGWLSVYTDVADGSYVYT